MHLTRSAHGQTERGPGLRGFSSSSRNGPPAARDALLVTSRVFKEVRAGGSPMSMQIARKVVAYFRQVPKTSGEIDALTEREREILGLLAKGLAYKQIADRLAISRSTVHGHLNAIYKKLHVQSGTEAVLKFLGKHP